MAVRAARFARSLASSSTPTALSVLSTSDRSTVRLPPSKSMTHLRLAPTRAASWSWVSPRFWRCSRTRWPSSLGVRRIIVPCNWSVTYTQCHRRVTLSMRERAPIDLVHQTTAAKSQRSVSAGTSGPPRTQPPVGSTGCSPQASRPSRRSSRAHSTAPPALEHREREHLARPRRDMLESYDNQLAYTPWPITQWSYGSNSVTSGLLEAVGAAVPNLPVTVPGYSNPIPRKRFHIP